LNGVYLDGGDHIEPGLFEPKAHAAASDEQLHSNRPVLGHIARLPIRIPKALDRRFATIMPRRIQSERHFDVPE
jgi:hypothetical protein